MGISRFVFVGILWALVGAALPADAQEYAAFQARLERTDPKDPGALLKLGAWCEDSDHPAWAAICYRRVLRLGESAGHAKAAFRLAKIELAKERYESGYRLLHELVAKHDHPEAKALLASAESQASRKQRDLVRDAAGLLEDGKAKKALQSYERAYQLLPKKPSANDFVPRNELLRNIAECRDRIDEAYHQDIIEPLVHSVRKCGYCTQYGGFTKCRTCNGKGTVRKKFKVGRRVVYRDVKCGTCNGYKWRVCTKCGGLQESTEKLTTKEAKAFKKILVKITNVKTLKKKLPDALKVIESTILDLDESQALSYFRTVKAGYSLSGNLRRSLGEIPPTDGGFEGGKAHWSAMGNDIRLRPNFLLSYACEYSKYLSPFERLRTQKRFDFGDVPSLEVPPSIRVTPEILAAFPDDVTGKWVTVDAMFLGVETQERQRVLEIDSHFPHDIQFFTWRPDAYDELHHLHRAGWKKQIGKLPDLYPFEIDTKLDAAPGDRQITMVGRFLRDRLGYPRNTFEIWDFEFGLTRDQQEIFARLSEPIEISFGNVELGEVVGFLRWYGVEVVVTGIDEKTRLRVEARDCPVGLLIDEIADALSATWECRDQQVVLARGGDRGEIAAVVRRLEALGSGTVDASTSGIAAADPPEPTPPRPTGDPAAIERDGSRAMREMNYAEAQSCFEALALGAKSLEDRKRFELEARKGFLYHHLTRKTPVSRLGGAGDLAHIAFKNPDGERFEQTVKITRRDASHVWVQPNYGGELRLPLDWLETETELTQRQWREQKAAELEGLAERLNSGNSQEFVNRLFILALFCKTYGFESRGTQYLDLVVEQDQFPWLLSLYFDTETELLASSWRDLRARQSDGDGGEEPEPPVIDDDPKPIPEGPIGEQIAKARQAYDKGRKHLSRALPGMEGASKERRKALEYFLNAEEALEGVLARDPSQKEAEQLMNKLTVMIQTCVKDLGFFD